MRLIYFSPVRAGSYAQRPHFMVRAWLDWGVESALWVNPYPCRLPQWQDVHRVWQRDEQGTPLDPRVRVLDAWALPIEPLPGGAWLNRSLLWRRAWREIEQFASRGPLILGIGRPSAMALAALRELWPTVSFFDAMDNFPEFYSGLSRRTMRRHEDAVAEKVDLVVASSTFLAEKFARRGLRVEKLLNACEFEERRGDGETGRQGDGETGRRGDGETGRQGDKETGRQEDGETGRQEDGETGRRGDIAMSPCLPVSQSPRLSAPRPAVLGYLGCIGHWFDWPLVIRLAEALPQAQVELVGPCAAAPPGRLPANVRLLPACRQSESVGYMARFSAGLIPRRASALTAGMDPVKYYEYRAAGLPVLSTRFGEMASRGRADGVYFLDETDDLAAVVAAALSHRRDAAEANRFRRENNWASRFRESDCFRSLWSASQMRRPARDLAMDCRWTH